MGKLGRFEIKLTNPVEVYYGGQMIDGVVELELMDEMKMRGVKLQLLGKAYVHWSESHSTGSGKNRRTETRHYSAHETYFNLEFILFGPTSGSTTLAAGSYSYPFTYTLPQHLPSSFEGRVGHVRYMLRARIDKPWKFDHKTKKMFTVVSHLDLNQQPNASLPVQGENSKSLCCLCCKSGPIIAKCHINRAGYVPGDTIHLNAEITNNSSRRMKSSRAKMYMITTFHATGKSKVTTNCVAEISKGEVAAHRSEIWTNERLLIPPIPPSFLAGCSIIDIRYVLQLEVDPAGPAFDLLIPLELVIGTIPLREEVQRIYPQWNQQTQPQQMAPSSSIVNPTLPGLPPPSYSECVFGKVAVNDEDDNEHTMGDKQFAPNYAYYDWSKSAFT